MGKNKLIAYLRAHVHFSKFLLVGCVNTAFDFFLFFIFANLIALNVVAASILSTGLTMILSFFLNHTFVFQSSRKKRNTILQFFAVTAFNVWVVQSGVIWIAVKILENIPFFSDHIWTLNLMAKLLGVGVSFILNFLMYRYIFHNKNKEELAVI